MAKEYAIWGTQDGVENVVRVNGKEVQTDLAMAKKIVSILRKRGEFSNLRVQTIDLGAGYNPAAEISRARLL